MTGRIRLDDLTSDQLDTLHDRLEEAERLLRDVVALADVTHKYGSQGGHDTLGANFSCAGCGLAARIAAHLDPGPRPSFGTGPRTGLDASVSAEQAQRAPMPAPAPERHAAGVLCGCGQPETVARVQTADGHVHLGPPMPAPTAEITVEGRPCHEMPGCDGECCEQAPADPLPLDGWTETTLDCQVDAMGPSPVHPDLVRVRIALPPGAGPDIDAEDGTDWAGLAALAQEQRERAEAAEAVLGRVREWIADQPVTAATPFGDGYREALRDIGDLIRPADHDATEETT